MYGHQKHISSACSEGFKSIQFTASPENCAQFEQNMFWFFLLADNVLRRPYGQDTTGISGFGVPSHGFSWWSPTLTNSNSAMPTSLRMSRHDFNTYSARSLDLAGRYTAKFAARDRKSSEKVGMFAFWAIRRCVRPYPGRRPGSAGRRIDTSIKIAPGPGKKSPRFCTKILFFVSTI